jgi:hypothetical protein
MDERVIELHRKQISPLDAATGATSGSFMPHAILDRTRTREATRGELRAFMLGPDVCAACLSGEPCRHAAAASQKKRAALAALQAMAQARETAAISATTKYGFDDTPRPIRQGASPPTDRELHLAFTVLLDLVERIRMIAPDYCDAATRTGRAIQAAIIVAEAHQAGTPTHWHSPNDGCVYRYRSGREIFRR